MTPKGDTLFSIGQRVQLVDKPRVKGKVIDVDTYGPRDRLPNLYVVDTGGRDLGRPNIFQMPEEKLAPYRDREEELAERFAHLEAAITALILHTQGKEVMRTTSSVKDTEFPFEADNVAFILVIPGGNDTKDARGFEHASHPGKKAELVEQAQALTSAGVDLSLLAVWPGATRSDVFLVDDLDAASEALA